MHESFVHVGRNMKKFVLFVVVYCLLVSFWKFFYGSVIWMNTYGISHSMLSEHQWYRLILGPFAHASLLHLWLNLYALYHFFWLSHYSKKKNICLMFTFIVAIPLAAFAFSCFSAGGYSVGISGGILAILGFLWVVDKNREVSNGLILIFLAGSLMPGVIDNISHASGFIWGCLVGVGYIRVSNKWGGDTETLKVSD